MKRNEDQVVAIRRHYKSLARVAKEINSEERHLNRLARGEVTDTKYRTGCRLLRIYRDICAKLNKQPAWTADLDANPVPEPIRLITQRTRPFSGPTPKVTGYIGPIGPSRSISDVARKFLNRSNACTSDQMN